MDSSLGLHSRFPHWQSCWAYGLQAGSVAHSWVLGLPSGGYVSDSDSVCSGKAALQASAFGAGPERISFGASFLLEPLCSFEDGPSTVEERQLEHDRLPKPKPCMIIATALNLPHITPTPPSAEPYYSLLKEPHIPLYRSPISLGSNGLYEKRPSPPAVRVPWAAAWPHSSRKTSTTSAITNYKGFENIFNFGYL